MSIEEKLSRLRPGMPVDDLIAIVGDAWEEPDPKYGNFFSWGTGRLPSFGARVDHERRLGQISFYKSFPKEYVIEGLYSQMPLDDVRRRYPDLEQFEEEGSKSSDILAFRCTASDGNAIAMRVKDGHVLGFDLIRSDAVYPEKPGPKLYPKDENLKAYEIELLERSAARGREDDHGWCFGLPPGITPEQWPLDKRSGHPMRHAFTLLLPEGYRRKGPDRVAISVFDGDWNGSLLKESAAVAEVWDALDAPPENEELMPVWLHRTGRHAHEYRIEDQLGEPYAVIWLTRAEFDGALCQPPLHPDNKTLRGHKLPKWTQVGAAHAYFDISPGTFVTERERFAERTWGIAPPPPPQDLAYHRALQWKERVFDPNAGVTPPEGWNDEEVTAWGYHRPYRFGESSPDQTTEGMEANFGPLDWAKDFTDHNIGGTMQPVQAYPTPAFSPYYVGIDEAMGGFNFGGGAGQLDLEEMRLDWACG